SRLISIGLQQESHKRFIFVLLEAGWRRRRHGGGHQIEKRFHCKSLRCGCPEKTRPRECRTRTTFEFGAMADAALSRIQGCTLHCLGGRVERWRRRALSPAR